LEYRPPQAWGSRQGWDDNAPFVEADASLRHRLKAACRDASASNADLAWREMAAEVAIKAHAELVNRGLSPEPLPQAVQEIVQFKQRQAEIERLRLELDAAKEVASSRCLNGDRRREALAVVAAHLQRLKELGKTRTVSYGFLSDVQYLNEGLYEVVKSFVD